MTININNRKNAIIHASTADLPLIYRLFEEAILYIKQNNFTGWTSYDQQYIQMDIRNGNLFKVLTGDEMLCFFSICFADPLIWRTMEKGNAVYLHRIVLNRKFRDEKCFPKIMDWAIKLAIDKNLRYIRMDTWAGNEKIIGYYKSYGFRFVEHYTTAATTDLPLQHRNLRVALLEYAL